jgi:glycine/D-amino acid oxidase-like deaminating enzyme
MLPFHCYQSDYLGKLRNRSLSACQGFFEKNAEIKAIENIPLIRPIIDPGDVDQAKADCEQLRLQGQPVEFVSQNDLGKLDLKMGSHVSGAIVCHRIPSIKSEQLYSALWKACDRHKKITQHWNTTVFGIEVKKEKVVGVRTQTGAIKAGCVLVAAGVESLGILSAIGIQLPAVKEKKYRLIGNPVRIKKSHFVVEYTSARENVKPNFNDTPIGDLQVSLSAFLGTDQYVSVGGGKELVISTFSSEPDVFNALGRHFLKILPGYNGLRFHKIVSRFDPLLVDGLPVVGCVPYVTGLYMALYARDDKGLIAPAIGESVGHWLTEEKPPDDMHPLFPERFPQTAPGGDKRVTE